MAKFFCCLICNLIITRARHDFIYAIVYYFVHMLWLRTAIISPAESFVQLFQIRKVYAICVNFQMEKELPFNNLSMSLKLEYNVSVILHL